MSGPRARVVATVYKKELVDTLRDRRTIATMVLVPMVTYPLMLLAVSEAALVEREAKRSRTGTLAALTELPEPLARALEEERSLVWTVRSATVAPEREAEEARRLISEGVAQVAVAVSATAAAALEGMGAARVTLYFDETSPLSRDAVERAEGLLDRYAERVRDARLSRLGVDAEALHPVMRRARSVATDSEVGGELASRFLPMLILVFIAISCFYPAIELTAGEKERGTLATLLTAPVQPMELVAGKYLAVVTIGTLAGLLNVGVMTLTVLRAVAGVGEAEASFSAALPRATPTLIVGSIVAVLLVAAVVGAVMLLAATFARSFRDANNLLTPVLLAVLAPAMLSSFPSAQLDARWAAVPIAGLVLWMKALLIGKAPLELAGVVIGASLGSAVLILGLAARVFGDERAMFASEGRRADARALFLGRPELGPGAAVAFTSVLFIGNYFLSGLLGGLPPLASVAILQLGLHAGLSIAFARWARAPELLPLRAPSGGVLAGAIGLGLVVWLGLAIPLSWLVGALVPGQEAAAEAFASQLSLGDTPLPLLVLGLAILPAIAEELAFRGVVLGALRTRLTIPGALVAQALLFGALHGSLFRLLPTAALGLLLGVLALRARSLVPSIVAHAIHNTILLSAARIAPEPVRALGEPNAWAIPAFVATAALTWGLARGLTVRGARP